MEQAQRQAKADAERARMRSEAEIADLRATISRLEVDLMKVNAQCVSYMTRDTNGVSQQANKAKAQELQTLQETLGEQLAEQTRAAQEAIGRLKVSESNLSEEVTKREKVSTATRGTAVYRPNSTGLTNSCAGRSFVTGNPGSQERHTNRAR